MWGDVLTLQIQLHFWILNDSLLPYGFHLPIVSCQVFRHVYVLCEVAEKLINHIGWNGDGRISRVTVVCVLYVPTQYIM